jgi:hypothetical protein
MFGVDAKRHLQTVDAFLGRLDGGAHPNPIRRVVLLGLEQACQQVFGAGAIPGVQGVHGFLKKDI